MTAIIYDGKPFKSLESRNRYINGQVKYRIKSEQWRKFRKYGDTRLRDWHNSIGYRDSWNCRICGHPCYGKRGESHHTISPETHPEVKYDEKYGIWLCIECHYAIHGTVKYDEYKLKHPNFVVNIDHYRQMFQDSKEEPKCQKKIS
jgi:rubrerythrin